MPSESADGPADAVMNTVNGTEFHPFDPRPAEVSLTDIAHGLSNICRCSGQTRRFYSVGRHSLYVARDLRERDATPQVQLYGLLHDAPEAYVSDVVAPVKRHLDGYRTVEERIRGAVWTAFGLPEPTDSQWEQVRLSDERLRRYEMDTLLPAIVDGEPPALGYDLAADDERDAAAAFERRARSLVADVDGTVP